MSKEGEALEKAYSNRLLLSARACPFCGGETLGMFPGPPSPIMPGDTLRVVCSQCLCHGPIGESAQRAVAKWNGDFNPTHRKNDIA
ncbi:hypothetical protein KKG90_03880 [Candidatus Bipolaricaulota bacterium]|nr:hypothetical protein [Candidatus Bipolaricaulota bacterium]